MSRLKPLHARSRMAADLFAPGVLFNRSTVWAWLILAASLYVTFGIWQRMKLDFDAETRSNFNRALAEARDGIDTQMYNAESLLRGAAGLVAAGPDLSRDDWRRYVNILEIEKSRAALQALVWAPRLERADLPRHVEAVRSEGHAGYAVFPAGENDVVTPVAFVEPFSGDNLRAFGYDMSTDAARRSAMRHARETGQPAITESLTLVTESHGSSQPGFLMFFPVFAAPAQAGQSGGKSTLLGYVAAAYRMQDLMQAALRNLEPHIHVQVYEETAAQGSTLLYDNLTDVDMPERMTGLATTEYQTVYGRSWRLAYTFHPENSAFYKDQKSEIRKSLIAGIAVSILLFILGLSQSMIKIRANRLANEMTAALRESEARWQFALESSGDGVFDWNLATERIFFSRRAAEMLGYREDEMPQTLSFEGWLDNIHPEDQAAARAAYARAMQAPKAGIAMEFRLRCKDGSYLWILGQAKVVETGPNGKPVRVIGTRTDISGRRKNLEQLRLAANVLEYSSDGIMITDDALRIVSVNPAFSRVTGYTPEEALGKTPHMLSSDRHDPGFYREMWSAITAQGYWQGEIWNRRKDGAIYPEWLTINLVKNDAGQIIHYVGIFSDITMRKSAEEKIRQLAHFDMLTHLPNRILLQDRLEQAIVSSRRKDELMAVIFLDLDHFKTINDTLGHHYGDELLKLAAVRLKRNVREGDTVARQGGDEFVIVLPNLHSAEDAAQVAKKLVAAMSVPYDLGGRELTITASIGISMLPTDAGDIDSLTKHADAAMYQAKEIGRNTYQFYTEELNRHDANILSLENDLRRAVERGQLILHFQPQMRIADRQIIGMEALVRWQHPEKGWIAPADFIPIAEQRGMITDIGDWILREACRQNRRLQLDGGPSVPVAVNISSPQFCQQNFAGKVKAALEESGLAARHLELELTESILMRDTHAVIASLLALKQLGVRMSIDDFGTGYSSLSYLKSLPIDKLKIDQSFVRDIGTDSDDAAITAAIINLARCLNMQVIAEGVETEQQLAFLRRLDCDEIQGFLFSKPLPPAELAAFFRVQATPSPELAETGLPT